MNIYPCNICPSLNVMEYPNSNQTLKIGPWDPKIFLTKIYFLSDFFGPNSFFRPIFLLQIRWYSNFFKEKPLLTQIFLDPKFCQNLFWLRNLWANFQNDNYVLSQIFWTQISLNSKFLLTQNIFGLNSFWTQNFFKQTFFGPKTFLTCNFFTENFSKPNFFS